MKAVGIIGMGDPDVVQVIDAADPSCGPSEVMIRPEATSYNHLDALLRQEDFGLDFPVVPGSDVVGHVISGSSELVGRRVLVNPAIPCGKCDRCKSGNQCRHVQILGVHRSGGYGQFVIVPSSQCLEAPDSLSPEELGSFPLVFLTAWRMLKSRARLSMGERVLIWGASGGLGSAAVAIAKALSARAIAIVRNSRHVAILENYGADVVIDASTVNVSAAVKSLTGGEGVDVVFEGPGADTWPTSMAVVSQGGRIVTAGVTSGSSVQVDLQDLYYRQVSILGSRIGYQTEFSEVLGQLLAGHLRPLISEVIPLSHAAEAHRRAARGDRCGKIVLRHDF